MKPKKQTVYLPVEITEEFWKKYDSGEERPKYEIVDANNGERIDEWVNEQKGYFFTPEQLNEYTANVVRQALENAAENTETLLWQNNEDLEIVSSRVAYIVEDLKIKQSITNTFEATFKQFEV
jgi:hypothetical protein